MTRVQAGILIITCIVLRFSHINVNMDTNKNKIAQRKSKAVDALQRIAVKNGLLIAIIVGIIVGLGIGLLLKSDGDKRWSQKEVMYIKYPGELFVRSVNCLVLPLVTCSVITASSGIGKSGRIGLTALFYYLTTTTLGIGLSVTLVHLVRPGDIAAAAGGPDKSDEAGIDLLTSDVLSDLLRNLIPDNIVKACLSQYQTVLIRPNNASEGKSMYEWDVSYRDAPGTNVLGLVFCSFIFGTAVGKLEGKGEPLLRVFSCFTEIALNLMKWLTVMTPLGIVSLTAGRILEIEEFTVLLERLAVYVLTVFIGLTIHGYVILPTVYFLVTHRSPYKVLRRMMPALLTACGTSSSAATVPSTTDCLDRIGIDRRVSRFVVPIGATINMDGIALYESVGAVFIIQLSGLEYSLMQIVVVSITCTVSCIGAAGLPNGGYTMLITVLSSFGVPVDDVALIIAIDCFADRYRTTINVIADALGSGIIEHLNKQYIDVSCVEGGNGNEHSY